MCEIDPNDCSLTNKYYYANSQILAQDAAYLTDPNDPNSTDYNRYYYLHDRLGSVRQVINNDANTLATYTYNPYGEDFASDCNDVNIYNPFKYTGQWYDAEIAQYYLRARQYDPQMMRFTGRDSKEGRFEEPITFHRYLYCANSPTYYVDLNGKNWSLPELIVTAGANAVTGAASGAMGGMAHSLSLYARGELDSPEEFVQIMGTYVCAGIVTSVISFGFNANAIMNGSYTKYALEMITTAIGVGVAGGLVQAEFEKNMKDEGVSAPARVKAFSDLKQGGLSAIVDNFDVWAGL